MTASANTSIDLNSNVVMDPVLLASQEVTKAIDFALAEDIGPGDATTLAVIAERRVVQASVVVKQKALVAGMNIFAQTFRQVDPTVDVLVCTGDGSFIDRPPAICAVVSGSAASILASERTALNFLQRLSGIATLTRQFVELAKPHGITILDTRKTTPCLRAMEKYAVQVGGGKNHRVGLYDAILIKDNHVLLAGGVSKAVERVRVKYPGRHIEVETTTLDEVHEALNAHVDAILLDNMSPQMVRRAAAIISSKCYVEVSGGITLDNIREYLMPGIKAISVGALTHSAPCTDISLEVKF